MPSRPHILVGTPCYGGLLTHAYLHSILKLTAYAAAHGIRVTVWTAAHDSLVTRSRNNIVASFLDWPEATHLMFVDADTGFEPEQIGRMLAFGQEVVAGMYPVKNIDWAAAARRGALSGSLTVEQLREAGLHFVGVPCPPAEREERDGFVTAEYAGTGFMLVRRSAFERMIAAHPETHYRRAQTYPAPANASTNLYALFDCSIDPETRTYLSEDFTFCKRWRALGGQVWLDTRSRLRHIGTYEYTGTPMVTGAAAPGVRATGTE